VQRFKVAAVQMNALVGELEHNLAVHDRFARKAAKAGARLVVFPELSVTAHYGGSGATALAGRARCGKVHDAMAALAGELGIVVSYGFCQKAHGTYYNSHALVGPEGFVGVQRKVHASRDEYLYFRMGRTLEVFDLGFCRLGTLICYDSDFFEAWRVLALKGAEVVLLPHAARSGPGKRIPRTRQVQSLRRMYRRLPGKRGHYAADNAVFAVHAGQADYNGHSTHCGGVFVHGPDGSVLAKGRAVLGDQMITATLDPRLLDKCRNRPGATLKTRRPELYGEITRML